MKSLQQHLSVALVISLIIIFPTLWWLTDSTMQNIAEKYVVSHLAQEAESVLAATQVDKTEKITLNAKQISPAYLQPFSGQYYQLHSGDEVTRSRSLWDMELNIPALAEGEKRRLYQSGPQQQSLLVMAYGYHKHDRPIVLAVAEDLSPTLAFIKPFQSQFILIALAILLLLITVQTIIVNSLLQPLKRLKRQIDALEQGQIDRLGTNVPKEVSPLVEAINCLLDEQEQPSRHARNDLKHLNHALTPPLTELSRLPDEAPIQSEPEAYHSLPAQNETTWKPAWKPPSLGKPDLSDTEQDNSDLALDIEQEILTLIGVLEGMYQEKNLDIAFIMPKTEVLLIDNGGMLELSGNLLKNACKWARSKVKLRIEIDEIIYLKIEDDGPGISETGMLDLEQSIVLDQATSGYLLGLTTARLIAQRHGGELQLRQSDDLGGYCVEIALPLATPQ